MENGERYLAKCEPTTPFSLSLSLSTIVSFPGLAQISDVKTQTKFKPIQPTKQLIEVF
jgi:hypothetical protein